ncbi:hypothetical protein DL93DRAFT_1796699 [Clavulina sp. PMI_390]|nr:hypothetical protein DL93DRAFT_1796699 [Clavulina sp. PMI_390]
MMLARGAACFECRRQKMKCDGTKPKCLRCDRHRKTCSYPVGVAKAIPITKALEARVLELEIILSRLTLSSAHNISLARERLLDRTRRLGRLPDPQLLDQIYPLQHVSSEESDPRQRFSVVLGDNVTMGELSALQVIVEEELRFHRSEGLEEISPELSIHLINLFLQYSSHYYFLADIPHFVRCLSLPPSHQDSIHPCLLNACYLGACASNGGGLASFKPYFLERTRRFLQDSLMFADRPTHFLWASIILGVFFGRERRLVECLAMAGATAHFAIACGLSLPNGSFGASDDSKSNEYLLPFATSKLDADDRVRLAHSLYIGGQTFPLLCGYPPMFRYDDKWSPISHEASLKFEDGKVGAVLFHYTVH